MSAVRVGSARRLMACIGGRKYRRIFGRFRVVRSGCGALLGGYQRLVDDAQDGGRASDRRPSLFADAPLESCVRLLRDEGVCFGFDLAQPEVSELHSFARTQPCVCSGYQGQFRFDDVLNGRLPDGHPVAVADVLGSEHCPAVQRIRQDAVLVEAVSRYLGYRARNIASRIFWSPRSDLPDEIRRSLGQTIDFHYDIEGLNAVYAYFYLTVTDRNSGAHVTIRNSHRRKPLSMILSSAFQPTAAVLGYYGSERMVTIEGGQGFGFLEAAECFHKALPPHRTDRLMLQIRYW